MSQSLAKEAFMKKAIVLLVSILLLFSLIASIAYADNENTYYLKTIELTLLESRIP